jgi:hypothetical protein
MDNNDLSCQAGLAELVEGGQFQKISAGQLPDSFHQALPLADQLVMFTFDVLFTVDSHILHFTNQVQISEVSSIQLPAHCLKLLS